MRDFRFRLSPGAVRHELTIFKLVLSNSNSRAGLKNGTGLDTYAPSAADGYKTPLHAAFCT